MKRLFYIFITLVIVNSISFKVIAQTINRPTYNLASLSVKNFTSTNTENTTTQKNTDQAGITNTVVIAEPNFNKKPGKKQLIAYIRKLNNHKNLADTQNVPKTYGRLAKVFARMRMYPLVMKCFLKSSFYGKQNYQTGNFVELTSVSESGETPIIPERSGQEIKNTDSVRNEGIMAINERDSVALTVDTSLFNHSGFEIESKPVENSEILNPFNDGKQAVKYAMLIHIQQPVSGKPKIFIKFHKVGHTFVTLIKYNSDSTYVARTFGFYPKKDNLLSATPIIPTTTSVFKNDENHDWDEVVGKFISKRRFEKILQLVKAYDKKKYNLNNNNCTDFGLNAAMIGGVKILNTFSSWPLGRGNNPAWAGQSVLEGKVINEDNDESGTLFIYNDIVKK